MIGMSDAWARNVFVLKTWIICRALPSGAIGCSGPTMAAPAA